MRRFIAHILGGLLNARATLELLAIFYRKFYECGLCRGQVTLQFHCNDYQSHLVMKM